MRIKSFEELEIWQESTKITVTLYKISNHRKFCKDFALKNQLRRAAISISSNIAEGFERNSNKEFSRFLKIAKASAGEVRSQIYLAKELNYIELDTYENLSKELEIISKKISALIKYLSNS